MRGLIGKKIGMTRVFNNEGLSVPVTVLNVGPCYVTQVKTIENDTNRDNFMSSDSALKYGIIDQIVKSKSK